MLCIVHAIIYDHFYRCVTCVVRLPRLIGLSRAMDMILTGRSVSASEALAMGLANRVVPDGTSRQAAEKLAAELSLLPQECMLSDRRSAYAQYHAPSFEDAMRNEFRGSKNVITGSTLTTLLKFSGQNSKNK